jgi:murein DD-endopeptidase MepM/ murein hydrolase activator NlpD
MRRSSAILLLVAFLVFVGPATGDPGADKEQVDARIQDLKASASEQQDRAGVLTEELSAVAGRVRELDGAVAAQETRLGVLASELSNARARRSVLDRTLREETFRLKRARASYGVATGRLEQRVHDLYTSDDPDVISVVLGTTSFTDLLDNVEFLNRIGEQDERIVQQVTAARDAIAQARRRTVSARAEAAKLEATVSHHVDEQRALVNRVAASRDALTAAQADRRTTLASIQGDRDEVLEEIAGLEKQSSILAATIRASQPAQATASPPGGSGQLSWPVSGPVTSGFGVRWGRMHEGIDIAVPSGTPVGAAASGTVIFAGWMSGYGNLVAIDHGNGLSTAYGHNSSLVVSVGQTVSAGAVIAYSGSTGHSTGPHVHFEVRVNGTPVDPLGYL